MSAPTLGIFFLKAVAIMVALFALPLPAYAQDSRLIVTVIGRDHDDVRSPLSGTAVRVTRVADKTLVASGTTDTLGLVELVVPALKGDYRVTATLDGYELEADIRGIVGVDVPSVPGDIAVGISLRMYPLDPGPDVGTIGPTVHGLLVGRLVLTDGTPMPGTHVEARRNGELVQYDYTAEDGSFQFSLQPGVYTIHSKGRQSVASNRPRASHGGDYRVPVAVATGLVTGPVDLVLEPLHLFYVKVKITNDFGEPVPNAHVSFTGGAGVERLPTSELGVFDVGPFEPGLKTFIARPRIGDSALVGLTKVEVQNADQDVNVVLRPAAQLSGRVEFDGRSIPLHGNGGIQVGANGINGDGAPSPQPALAGSDGRFVVRGVVGPVCVYVTGVPSPWYVLAVTHQSLDVTGKVLTLSPGEMISDLIVRVVRAEGPIPEQPKCKP